MILTQSQVRSVRAVLNVVADQAATIAVIFNNEDGSMVSVKIGMGGIAIRRAVIGFMDESEVYRTADSFAFAYHA